MKTAIASNSLLAIVCFSTLATGFSAQPLNGQDDLEFNPQVAIRQSFPAIVQPKTVSVDEANKALHAKELVLGVEIDGIARAYPINMLTGPQREIINDQLGGKSIAATW